MRTFSAVCFDLFNTLVSVAEVPLSVGRLTADILGVDAERWNEVCFGPDHEICRPTQHADIIRVLAHSLDSSISLAQIEQATRERQDRFDYALCQIRPGILDTLRLLRQQGFKTALISNASSGEVAAWSRSPLVDLFDVSLFSCECGYQKPDPAIYQLALGELGVSADECVYIGDGGSQEFIGAHKSGMYTVLTREFLKPVRYARVIAEQSAVLAAEIGELQQLPALLKR